MNRNTSKLVKILVSLFALNSLTLYFYFSSDAHHHHPPPPPPPQPHPINHHQQQQQQLSNSKPWPMLPSYLPWSSSQNPDVKIHSCEAYFGNGFQTRLDLLNSSSPAATGGGGSGGGGWFRCFYSETLRSSVCEGGKVKMNVGKIRMSRGGERLEEVIGRTENEEMPVFEDGAFEVEVNGDGKLGRRLVSDEFLDSYVPEGEILLHTMRDLLRSIRVVDPQPFDDCEQWVEEPTLLVTRFEYANLFHTVTDWYGAYVSSRVTGLPNRPHVVFVDGHCKTQLEETWDALFSSIRYAKNFSRSVCFRHAVLSPLGYETPLFKGLSTNINCQGAASARDLWRNPDDRKTARLSEFGEMIRVAFGFQVVNRHQTEKSESSHHNVLFVRREDYLAHPRHAGKVQARLSNEQEVFDSIQRWVSDHPECKINLVNGLFAHMSMKEQVKHIQDASVIIGAHGAGLTHIVSAAPKTVILEIISSQFRRPHFQLISQWKGLEYHAINLDGSYANPAVVIDKLSDIMTSLGCRSFQHGR